MLELKRESKDDIRLVVAKGRINSETAEQFSDFVEDITHEGSVHLVIELCGVEYISSAGLRILLNAKKRMGKDRVFLACANATVRKVLKIAGLTENVIEPEGNASEDLEKYFASLKRLLPQARGA